MWHFHVFKTVLWGTKVENFNVKAQVAGSFYADHTVPKDFGGGEVCRAYGKVTGVID